MKRSVPSLVLNPFAPENPPWWGVALLAVLLLVILAPAVWFQIKMRSYRKSRQK